MGRPCLPQTKTTYTAGKLGLSPGSVWYRGVDDSSQSRPQTRVKLGPLGGRQRYGDRAEKVIDLAR